MGACNIYFKINYISSLYCISLQFEKCLQILILCNNATIIKRLEKISQGQIKLNTPSLNNSQTIDRVPFSVKVQMISIPNGVDKLMTRKFR